jgi:hypothetical protein
MLLVAPVVKRRRLNSQMADEPGIRQRINTKRSDVPAITHVDYPARIQPVNPGAVYLPAFLNNIKLTPGKLFIKINKIPTRFSFYIFPYAYFLRNHFNNNFML